MVTTLEERIEILWAKDRIRELALRYCRACDRNDPDLLQSVYHPDAVDEHGFNTSKTAREFLDAMPAMRKRMNGLQHNVTNHLIHVDGDHAEGEVYVLAYHRYEGANGPELLVTGGRYLDRYERRAGDWKIAHRRCVDDWSVKLPAPPKASNDFTNEALAHGTGDRSDPSYAFFRQLV